MNQHKKLLSMVRTDLCRDRAPLRRQSTVSANRLRVAAISLAGGVLALGLALNGLLVAWTNGARESPTAAMRGERADEMWFWFGPSGKTEDAKRTIKIAAEDIKFDKGTISLWCSITISGRDARCTSGT